MQSQRLPVRDPRSGSRYQTCPNVGNGPVSQVRRIRHLRTKLCSIVLRPAREPDDDPCDGPRDGSRNGSGAVFARPPRRCTAAETSRCVMKCHDSSCSVLSTPRSCHPGRPQADQGSRADGLSRRIVPGRRTSASLHPRRYEANPRMTDRGAACVTKCHESSGFAGREPPRACPAAFRARRCTTRPVAICVSGVDLQGIVHIMFCFGTSRRKHASGVHSWSFALFVAFTALKGYNAPIAGG